MITISASQIAAIGDERKSTFKQNLWLWLNDEGSVWPSRDEADREALYARACALADQHEVSVERYIAMIAHAIDGAGDWQKFCDTDDLVTGQIHPDIDAPSFVKQLPQRAQAFVLENDLMRETT